MSDCPTVDRVIADLKRLAGGLWATDREREIGNVMVDARHCLEQLLAEVGGYHNSAGIAQDASSQKQSTCNAISP
jgi:hypothetical protein